MSIKMTKNMWVGILALTSVISAPTIAETTTYSYINCIAQSPKVSYLTAGGVFENDDTVNELLINCPIPYNGTTVRAFTVNVHSYDYSTVGGIQCLTSTSSAPPNGTFPVYSTTPWVVGSTSAATTPYLAQTYFDTPVNTIVPGPYASSTMACKLGKKDGLHGRVGFMWYTVTTKPL